MKTIQGRDFPQRNKAYMSNGDIFLFMLMKISILPFDIKCLGKAHLEKVIKSKINGKNYRYYFFSRD